MKRRRARPVTRDAPSTMRRVWRRPLAFLQRGKRPEPLPIRLHGQRIFILPTGFGAGFAMVLTVMLAGALNYGNNAALLLTALLGVACAGSLLSAYRGLERLTLVRVHGQSVHAGTPLRLQLEWQADGRARHALLLESDGQEQAFALPADANLVVHLQVATRRRGWQPTPRLRLHTSWPFGLFRAWAWMQPEQAWLVYPHAEPQGPPAPGAPDRDPRPAPRREAGEQPASLREYRHGDPLKRVAWKASARHEHLLVRRQEDGLRTQPALLAWADTAELEHEARIARLTRWVLEASARNQPWALRLPRQTLGPGVGPQHAHACLRALALLP